MVPNELLEYVKLSFARGTSTDSIYSTLMGQGGWTKEDIDQAFLIAFPGVSEKPITTSELQPAPANTLEFIPKQESNNREPKTPETVIPITQTQPQTNSIQIKEEVSITNTQTKVPKPPQINQNQIVTPYSQIRQKTEEFGQVPVIQTQNIQPSKFAGLMRTILKTLLILIVVAGMGVGGYFVYGYFTKDKSEVVPEGLLKEEVSNVYIDTVLKDNPDIIDFNTKIDEFVFKTNVFTDSFPFEPLSESIYNLKDQGFGLLEVVLMEMATGTESAHVQEFKKTFSKYSGGGADGGFVLVEIAEVFPFRWLMLYLPEDSICKETGSSFIDGFITKTAEMYFIGAGCIDLENSNLENPNYINRIGQTWKLSIFSKKEETSVVDDDTNTLIKSNLSKIRIDAEFYLDSSHINNGNFSYIGLCNDDEISSSLNEISKISGNPALCVDTETTWVASAQLVTEPNQWWCVDSTFESKAISTNITPQSTECPAN